MKRNPPIERAFHNSRVIRCNRVGARTAVSGRPAVPSVSIFKVSRAFPSAGVTGRWDTLAMLLLPGSRYCDPPRGPGETGGKRWSPIRRDEKGIAGRGKNYSPFQLRDASSLAALSQRDEALRRDSWGGNPDRLHCGLWYLWVSFRARPLIFWKTLVGRCTKYKKYMNWSIVKYSNIVYS